MRLLPKYLHFTVLLVNRQTGQNWVHWNATEGKCRLCCTCRTAFTHVRRPSHCAEPFATVESQSPIGCCLAEQFGHYAKPCGHKYAHSQTKPRLLPGRTSGRAMGRPRKASQAPRKAGHFQTTSATEAGIVWSVSTRPATHLCRVFPQQSARGPEL